MSIVLIKLLQHFQQNQTAFALAFGQVKMLNVSMSLTWPPSDRTNATSAAFITAPK